MPHNAADIAVRIKSRPHINVDAQFTNLDLFVDVWIANQLRFSDPHLPVQFYSSTVIISTLVTPISFGFALVPDYGMFSGGGGPLAVISMPDQDISVTSN